MTDKKVFNNHIGNRGTVRFRLFGLDSTRDLCVAFISFFEMFSTRLLVSAVRPQLSPAIGVCVYSGLRLTSGETVSTLSRPSGSS